MGGLGKEFRGEKTFFFFLKEMTPLFLMLMDKTSSLDSRSKEPCKENPLRLEMLVGHISEVRADYSSICLGLNAALHTEAVHPSAQLSHPENTWLYGLIFPLCNQGHVSPNSPS